MAGPRKKQNTEFLLDKFLEGVSATEDVKINKVYLGDLNIGHCTGCDYCEKTGYCFQKDDMSELYDEFNSSDGIILASPIFFNNMTSFGKAMVDRCQIYWSSKYVLNKPSIDREKKRFGVLLCTAGAPDEKDKFLGTEQVASLFFRAVNTQLRENFLVANTDKVKTWEDEEYVNMVYQKGKSFFSEF